MAGPRNVFVSHIHEDEAHIQKMKDLLAGRGFEVRDSSITSEKGNDAKDREYIKHGIIAPKIRWAGAVVVLISPGMRDSEYVDFEIEYANRHDTRIVGVWTHGAADSDIPEALAKYADRVVPWGADAIINAICGTDTGWETPEGNSRAPLAIARHGC